MVRRFHALLLVSILLAPLAAATITTAWEETWEQGTSSWTTHSGNPQRDCAQGYVTGCALKVEASWDGLAISRPVEWAQIGGDTSFSWRYKASEFSGPIYTQVAISYTAKDGSWHSVTVGTTDGSRLDIWRDDGWSASVGNIPQAGQYYTVFLDFGSDALMSYNLQNDIQQITNNPLADMGSAIDVIHEVTITGSGIFHARKHFIDDVHVFGNIGPMTAPGAPENVQARITPTLDELLAGSTGPAPGTTVVSWSPPTSDGNRPIQHYTLTRSGSDGTRIVFQGLALEYTDTLPGTGTYTYTVTATNTIGTGPASLPAPVTGIGGLA